MSEIDEIPKPENSNIKLVKIETAHIPHPYCITSKHVAWASDHFFGRLGHEAIVDAETHGKAVCGICKGKLKYGEHESKKTLFIEVPQNKDLNAVEGLNAYLLKIKPIVEKLGVEGIAFPKK